MMRLIIFFGFQVMAITCIGQTTEFNCNVYSGVFSYRGNGASGSSTINGGVSMPAPYTDNVYGTKPGVPVSIEAQVIKSTGSNFLYGSGLSYDVLKSNITINQFVLSPEVILFNQSYRFEAKGNTALKNDYININPFIGKRFLKNKIRLDLLGGVDFGFCIKSVEQGHAVISASQEEVSTNARKPHPAVDMRPRIQMNAAYKRTGIIIGYSLGLTNYQNAMPAKAYSSFIRLGLSYRVR